MNSSFWKLSRERVQQCGQWFIFKGAHHSMIYNGTYWKQSKCLPIGNNWRVTVNPMMEYYATVQRGLWRILSGKGKCAHDLIFSVTSSKCKYVSKMLNMYVYMCIHWRKTTDTVTHVGLVEKKEHFKNLSSLRKQPSVHWPMNGLPKCGIYIQWSMIQP